MMHRFLSSSLWLIALFSLWLIGFLNFVSDIQALPEPQVQSDLQTADAIIVLTGGSERVTTGIELLEAGMGKKLFISGVHRKLTLDGIIGTQQVAQELRDCCIILGYRAGSTHGNADEVRDWMTQENYTSMRLVTANYHMPRALLLLHAALPDAHIIPHPIAPESVKLQDWWQYPGTVSLLATEYTKFIIASVKVWVGIL